MPLPVGGGYQQQGPSCFDRMKMGFAMGFCIGMASGVLFGGFSALRLLFTFYVLKNFQSKLKF